METVGRNPPLGKFGLLPCPPDVCQDCGVDHAPGEPHDAMSLYYQYKFYCEHQRWPTWADAIAHCDPTTRRLWETELRRVGRLAVDQETKQGARVVKSKSERRIVCLCGSTRFYDAFQKANFDETMAGRIVLTVGFYPHSHDARHGEGVGHDSAEKLELDKLHKDKIDLADEILVLNVGGYIGSSTRSEIGHAMATGKPVRYLEPIA